MTLGGVTGVAHLSAFTQTPTGGPLAGRLIPSSSPQQPQTATLFDCLIGTSRPQALVGSGAVGYVTGNVPLNIQFAATLACQLPFLWLS
jgi:hypothetical protein